MHKMPTLPKTHALPPLRHFVWLLLPLVWLTGCFPERPPQIRQVALADLDGDGALDVVLASGRFGEPYSYPTELTYQVLYNNGAGEFAHTAELPQQMHYFAVALGDLDNDGMLDAILNPGLSIAWNDGRGMLQRSSHIQGVDSFSGFQGGIALADLDGDGALDIFVAECCGSMHFGQAGPPRFVPSTNLVLLNDGNGTFHNTMQALDTHGSTAVALGDLNGNGSPDAFVANGPTMRDDGNGTILQTPNSVWFNDGNGFFTASQQDLGTQESHAVALGDLNGDGALDAVVGNQGPDEIWLNDGHGLFTLLGTLPTGPTKAVFLVDLDGDDVLDLVTAEATRVRLWRNDGQGNLSALPANMRYSANDAVAVGDLNGNGLPDIFVAYVDDYAVWFNQGDGSFRR